METPQEAWCWTEFHDGFILCVTEGERLLVYGRDAAGLYDLRIDAPLPAEERLNNVQMYGAEAVAFDGERIAFASALRTEEGVSLCGYLLSVYGPEGLRYCGSYCSSLDLTDQSGYLPMKCAVASMEMIWTQ